MATTFPGPSSNHDPTRYALPLGEEHGLVASEQVSAPSPSFDEPEQLPDDVDVDSFAADDDSRWDVFLPDDDEIDPLPEPGDFWFDDG